MKKIKKRIKITKVLILIMTIFVVINTALLGINAIASVGINYVTQSENITDPEAINFLIVGTDLGGNRTFEKDGVRTDVQMVISFNPKNERNNLEINVMNIPRDVTTDYACGGKGKINGAASTGAYKAQSAGTDLTQGAVDCSVQTVEQLFDINIDYYIAFNFDSFISIVDGIGGIDVINPYQFCEQDENGTADANCFEEGKIHLDGSQALSYARQRHQSSDYERGQRQQLIMTKIFAKIMSKPSSYADDFATVLVKDTINNLDTKLLISLLNWATTNYNNSLKKISAGSQLYLDIKSSSFSNDTGFNLIDSFSSKLDSSHIGSYPIYNLYSTYDTVEQSTNIDRYSFTKENLNLPTTIAKEEAEPSTIELQFISTFVHEDNSSLGFYSYIDDYTISYLHNQFKNNSDEEEK